MTSLRNIYSKSSGKSSLAIILKCYSEFFWENRNAENYHYKVSDLKSYKDIECHMFLKIHFLVWQ